MATQVVPLLSLYIYSAKMTPLGLSRPLEGRFGRSFVVRHVNMGDADGQVVSRPNILDLWILQLIFRFRERAGPIYIGPKWHTKRCNSLDIDLRAKRGPGSEFPVLPWWFWYPTLLPYDKICTFYSSFSIPILRIPGLSRFFMFFEPKMTGMGLSRLFLGRFGSNFVVVDVNGDPERVIRSICHFLDILWFYSA